MSSIYGFFFFIILSLWMALMTGLWFVLGWIIVRKLSKEKRP